MSMKEFLNKKKESWNKYQAKRDALNIEKERTSSLKLKLDSQRAESDLIKLKEQTKYRKKIQDYEDYKTKTKAPSKFGSMMSSAQNYASGFDSAKGSSSVFGSGGIGLGSKSSNKKDMFGNMFNEPVKKRKSKKRKSKKRK